MFMKLEQETEKDKEERLKKEKEKSFSSKIAEEVKDEMLEASIEASINQASGLVNLTLPLDQFQMIMSVFKMIDKTININNEKGISR